MTIHGIRVSNPQRVIDPTSGRTKLDLVRYYESVAAWMLPHLRGRPVALTRGPRGIKGQLFVQKHAEHIRIPGITELDPRLWPGHEGLLAVESLEALVGAAQMNVIEFHTWNATSSKLDKPDRMVLDLDPGEDVAWQQVQDGAELTRALLRELGLQGWLKTSGGRGLHVVVPLAPRWRSDTIMEFSRAIVQHLADTIPDRFVAQSSAPRRVGKIFVDYLRNGLGATTVAAYSARAREGLSVSMPISWDELGGLKSGAQWTTATALAHASSRKQDPWADYWKTKQSLSGAIKALAAWA